MWKIGQTLADGQDAGIVNAKRIWAEKLAGFIDHPEAIKRVLNTLPPEPPTLPQFIELLRHVPKEEPLSLPHKPTPDELEHQREMSSKIAASIRIKRIGDDIDRDWATKPRSAIHLRFIFDAAKNDDRFKPCVAQMVRDGICTAEGKLLKAYKGGGAWSSQG